MPKLIDPYPDLSLEGDNVARLSCRISMEDFIALTQCRPAKGTTQLVLSHLIKYLTNELRRNNLTSWQQRAEFERFICQRFPIGESNNDARIETNERDDGRGANRVRSKAKTKQTKSPDVSSNPQGGAGNKQAA